MPCPPALSDCASLSHTLSLSLSLFLLFISHSVCLFLSSCPLSPPLSSSLRRPCTIDRHHDFDNTTATAHLRQRQESNGRRSQAQCRKSGDSQGHRRRLGNGSEGNWRAVWLSSLVLHLFYLLCLSLASCSSCSTTTPLTSAWCACV